MGPQLVQNIKHRRDVMRTLLIIIFLGGLCFSVLNFYRHVYVLAFLELAYAIYSITLLKIISKTDHFQRWVIAFIIPLFTLIVYALTLTETSKSMFVWILSFPIVSYLLMGKRVGLWMSLFFISISLGVYHAKFLNLEESLNIAESLNVIFSSALMIAFAHVYEKNREDNEIRLLELAGTDSLTNIPNRLKLYETFSLWAKSPQAKNSPMSVALIDLDHFKDINDKYGHSIGDEALRHVVNFINSKGNPKAMLARIGGEEFALKMMNTSTNECFDYVDSLREQLSNNPLSIDNHSIKITFSAGISTFGDDGTTLNALLASADKRLYIAKSQGRNCVCFTADLPQQNIAPIISYDDSTEKSDLC